MKHRYKKRRRYRRGPNLTEEDRLVKDREKKIKKYEKCLARQQKLFVKFLEYKEVNENRFNIKNRSWIKWCIKYVDTVLDYAVDGNNGEVCLKMSREWNEKHSYTVTKLVTETFENKDDVMYLFDYGVINNEVSERLFSNFSYLF